MLFGNKSSDFVPANNLVHKETATVGLATGVHIRLQEYLDSQEQFPCHIKSRTRSGFVVQGLGTKGFLPFNLMPWRYEKRRSWVYVADDFIGHRIFCRIEQLSDKESGYIRFIASADVHNYYKPRLISDDVYHAVVLHTNHSHVLLDLGVHFDWKKGSVPGVQHRSDFEEGVFESIQKGQYIDVRFQCYHVAGMAMCGREGLDPAWYDVTWSGCEGEILLFDVVASDSGKQPRLFYEGYEARLLIQKLQFGEDRKKVDLALRRLETGDKVEARIVKYYPERGAMSVRLTEEQAEILLSESVTGQTCIGKLYAEMEHSEGMTKYTLVHKERGVVALLELNVEVRYEGMEVKELTEITEGPYQPKYQIWTTKTNPMAIVKDYYDHLFLTNIHHTVLGKTMQKGPGYIEEMWDHMKDGLFFERLLDRLKERESDLDVTREKNYWVVKGSHFNIVMDYGPALRFRFLRWWETVDYISTRYFRVRVSHTAHRRLSIQIDHHKVIVATGWDDIEGIVEECCKHLLFLLPAIPRPSGSEPQN